MNGININYEVRGHGEPLVLVMGLGATKGCWFFQASVFEKYYRVITFDNRGVGKTDKPSKPYTIKTMADDTIGLMDCLGVDKAHVLGVSLGGMIAQELAINYPERVRNLILGCTFAETTDIVENVEIAGLTAIRGRILELQRLIGLKEDFSEADILDLKDVDMGAMVNSVISLTFNRRLFKVLFVPAIKVYLKFTGINGIIGQLKAIATCNTLDRLHRVKAPSLVIVGTGDRLIPPHSSEVIANRIPNARLVKVDGGSHMFFIEMRGRFNRAVLDFLRGG